MDRAHRIAELIPGSRLELIDAAGHLIQIDQPVAPATILHDCAASALLPRSR